MVPLLKRHLSLPRSGITTKGINSGGAHPQSNCEHAENAFNICICPRRTCRPLSRLTWSPSPLWCPFPYHPCQLHNHHQGPSDWPRVTCVEVPSHPSWLSPFGEPLVPPVVGHHQCPWHPWLVLVRVHCLGGAHWGEVGYPPPTPDRCPHTRGATVPCSNVVPYLHTHQGQIQSLMGSLHQTGCSKTMHCGHHIRCGWEC